MNLNDKSRILVLAEIIDMNAKEIRMLAENGDSVQVYFAIDMESMLMFDQDTDFRKLEARCQKSEKREIYITSLKSTLRLQNTDKTN